MSQLLRTVTVFGVYTYGFSWCTYASVVGNCRKMRSSFQSRRRNNVPWVTARDERVPPCSRSEAPGRIPNWCRMVRVRRNRQISVTLSARRNLDSYYCGTMPEETENKRTGSEEGEKDVHRVLFISVSLVLDLYTGVGIH